ncbi:LysR family transcriptional regulator [Hazenella sp. IB182357]|uniref:LysR family transcriptional regulator n=1 Tax=Polycladospora coralii TaxID=2771432 RepID=A0A926N7E4_9BACL|nr:LysR family transcriptional regulator [Polycladospora coralii]MBD1370987.1 LysR family transcriptional regulator [Polycladospora coralii]MBS7529926.1 LysR family transcriptional regulator [Polycladospora coralii]
MRIDWLIAFQTTAELRSLTKASEVLHLSQPALGKQIRSLERDVNAQLFLRSATGVALTPEGEILLRYIPKILYQVQQLRKEITSSEQSKTITIGSWPSISTFYLPRKLAQLNSRTRDIKFNIKISHSFTELIDRLEQGDIDVILCDDTVLSHPYTSAPLFTEAFQLFVHASHPLAQEKSTVSFEQIKHESFVTLPSTCDIRLLIEQGFKQRNTQFNVSTELEFGQSILGFISANLGKSILPTIFKESLHSEMIRVLPITGFNIQRKISLIAQDEALVEKMYTFMHE